LDFRWLTSATNEPPVALTPEGLGQRGAAAGGGVATTDELGGVERRRLPTGVTVAGL
jgi:hypothetical protein